MPKITKVGTYKVRPEWLENKSSCICEECGCETALKTQYRAIRYEIDAEELDLILLEFEEVDVSECCESLVHVSDDECIGDVDSETYVHTEVASR